jgi:hypothetical protein
MAVSMRACALGNRLEEPASDGVRKKIEIAARRRFGTVVLQERQTGEPPGAGTRE